MEISGIEYNLNKKLKRMEIAMNMTKSLLQSPEQLNAKFQKILIKSQLPVVKNVQIIFNPLEILSDILEDIIKYVNVVSILLC